MTNCRLCDRFVGTSTVTLGTGSLVLNIPAASFNNCQRLCLAILQEIPTTATINTPVVITIGEGTTEYPLVRCDGNPISASDIVTRGFYKVKVQTNATSAVFKIIGDICHLNNNLPSIP